MFHFVSGINYKLLYIIIVIKGIKGENENEKNNDYFCFYTLSC